MSRTTDPTSPRATNGRRASSFAGRRIGIAAFALLLASLPAHLLAAEADSAETVDHSQHDHDRHNGHDHDASRPDLHAPIGVMGDHPHPKGEWMASYRYMRMDMQPNRIGTTDVAPSQILRPGGTLGAYGAVPTRMTMDMHMFGLMYAPSDRVTLMAMVPFLDVSMDHVTMTNQPFTTESTGLGDIGAAALISIYQNAVNQFILNVGMTFPSGSIDRTGMTPASGGANVVLPYPMQLGSGTWDLRPGLTYNGRVKHFSWGAQVMGTIRMGRNDQNYRLGHAYEATGWGAWKVAKWVSASGRVAWEQWYNIVGQDTRLMSPNTAVFPTAADFIPTANPNMRSGKRLDIGPGLNFVVPGGPLEGVRIAVEALFPVYQNLAGPQLATDWTLVVGTQYAF